MWRENAMRKTYREWSPNQPHTFPPSPEDWLPEDDLVCFVWKKGFPGDRGANAW
jgi:hypothetical protein